MCCLEQCGPKSPADYREPQACATTEPLFLTTSVSALSLCDNSLEVPNDGLAAISLIQGFLNALAKFTMPELHLTIDLQRIDDEFIFAVAHTAGDFLLAELL